jgi:hypothetical protein
VSRITLSVADASTHCDRFAEAIDAMRDHNAAVSIFIVGAVIAVVAVVVGADIDTARTNVELHGVRGSYGASGNSCHCGKCQDKSLHIFVLLLDRSTNGDGESSFRGT